MSRTDKRTWLWIGVLVASTLVIAFACGGRQEEVRRGGVATGGAAAAAAATYVPPGDLDEFYLFYSGGHSGQVYVGGIPSMRHIATIPVFAPYPATGYGFDDETKEMLGGFTWGDVHHPSLSRTNGEYDGRWLFVNDNANARVARIDLRDFKTKQIFGPIPNASGNHGSAFATASTEYILYASRFGIPLPKGTFASIDEYATRYKGVVGALAVDPESGEMTHGFQIVTAAVQLGPRLHRSRPVSRLGAVDLLQLGARHRRVGEDGERPRP
jgi:nitrous-oxide reductase